MTGTSVRFAGRVAPSSRPRSTTSSVGVSWTRRNGSHPSYCARRAGPVTRNVARNVRRSSRTWAEQRYGRANSCESREPRRRDHRMITARDSEPLARHGIVSCRVLRTWSLTCDDASSSELVVTVGYAPRRAVRNCKTLDTGSIPVAASTPARVAARATIQRCEGSGSWTPERHEWDWLRLPQRASPSASRRR